MKRTGSNPAPAPNYFFTEHSLILAKRSADNRKIRGSSPFVPTKFNTGHSLIGKAAGLYPVLAADYREITGSNPVAPNFQGRKPRLSKGAILPQKQPKSRLYKRGFSNPARTKEC